MGCRCGEDDRLDSSGAALLSWFNWACLLRRSYSVAHIRIFGTHYEWRVHRCSQLRPLHSQGREMEWATGHDRLLLPHCHRALHPHSRLSLKCVLTRHSLHCIVECLAVQKKSTEFLNRFLKIVDFCISFWDLQFAATCIIICYYG